MVCPSKIGDRLTKPDEERLAFHMTCSRVSRSVISTMPSGVATQPAIPMGEIHE